jgi:hypothetical protein
VQSQQQAERKTRGFQAAYLLHVPKCLWDKSRPRCARPAPALRLHGRATRTLASSRPTARQNTEPLTRGLPCFSGRRIAARLAWALRLAYRGQRRRNGNDAAGRAIAPQEASGRRASDALSTSPGTSRDWAVTSLQPTAHLCIASR